MPALRESRGVVLDRRGEVRLPCSDMPQVTSSRASARPGRGWLVVSRSAPRLSVFLALAVMSGVAVFQRATAAEPDTVAPPPRREESSGSAGEADSGPPPGDVLPFVLRVLDPDKYLQGRQPRITIDNGVVSETFVPQDNGEPPDTQAGDGSYALGVANLAGSSFEVLLQAGEGDAAFRAQGQVTFSSDNLERNLIVLVKKETAVFGTNDKQLLREGSGSAPATRAGPAGREPGSGEGSTSLAGARGAFVWALIFGIVGGLVGAFLYQAHAVWRAGRGMFRAGRGRPMYPFGSRLPGTRGPAVWRTSPDAWIDLTITLARRLTTRGAVLVVPVPGHREDLEAAFAPLPDPVWFPARLRPSPTAIIAFARRIEAMGMLVTLVVEGIEALEEAHPDAPFAALEDLVGASPAPVWIVASDAVSLPETDWPVVRVVRDERDGLATEDGQPLSPGPAAS